MQGSKPAKVPIGCAPEGAPFVTLLTGLRGIVIDRRGAEGGVEVIIAGKIRSLHPDVVVLATA